MNTAPAMAPTVSTFNTNRVVSSPPRRLYTSVVMSPISTDAAMNNVI
jgi:hypothetical protein